MARFISIRQKAFTGRGRNPDKSGKYIGILNPDTQELLKNRKLSTLTPEILAALKKAGIEYA